MPTLFCQDYDLAVSPDGPTVKLLDASDHFPSARLGRECTGGEINGHSDHARFGWRRWPNLRFCLGRPRPLAKAEPQASNARCRCSRLCSSM